jgi:DnaJ-class molecular chaperone
MPDEPCEVCRGKGIRDGAECTNCHGKGERRPWEAHYHLNRESIEEFTLFLENCGGFEIW